MPDRRRRSQSLTVPALVVTALLAIPAAQAQQATAVRQQRAIPPHSAVRSVRAIGVPQSAAPAGSSTAIAASAAANGSVTSQQSAAAAAATSDTHAVVSAADAASTQPARTTPDAASATPAPAPAPAADQVAAVTADTAPATTAPTTTSGDGAVATIPAATPAAAAPDARPAFVMPLAEQAQSADDSAVVAQAPIGADNLLATRPWYDTTLGRIGIIAGGSAIASLGDRGVRDWALHHRQDWINRKLVGVRDVLPWPAFWVAAATSFPSPWADDKLAHTSTVAVTSGILASAATLALKAVIGRDRPDITSDPYQFTAFNPRYSLIYGGSSFPSGHTTLTWALITPYARTYHLPWLYALGVLSAAGRIAQNVHWFSDVVGGSLLGYYTARWTQEHMNDKANVQWIFTGNGLYLFKRF